MAAAADAPIGVFDSGVGGISVLRELIKILPQEQFIYFGDSANAPYGKRSSHEIRALSLSAAQMLADRGCKALVVACNTATAAAITELRQQFPHLIVVGIEPALKVAADRFPGGNIGVMATPVTLREEKFSNQLARFPQVTVHSIPVTGLVELIEAGKADEAETEALLRPYLESFAGKLDALVLGCTHYPFARRAIEKILGSTTVLLDGGEGTARETKRRLQDAGLLRTGEGQVQLENSLADPKILTLCAQLLQQGGAV